MAQQRELVLASNQLGLSVYRGLKPQEANVCFSPISLTTSLLLTRAATNLPLPLKTRWSLDTWDQETIHLINQAWMNTLPNTIVVSNAVFVRDSNPTSPPKATRLFDAEVIPLDFEDNATCVRLVNQWAKKATHGKISQVINTFPSQTTIFTVNAVYFLANWKHPFEVCYTRTDSFSVNEDTTIQTLFMNQRFVFPVAEHQGWNVLEMPYDDDVTSLLICLPHSSLDTPNLVTDTPPMNASRSIDTLDLSPSFFQEVLDKLKPVRLDVSIPKFTFECTLDLSAFVFSEPSDMVIVQKTYIQVNERGTLAAAVTALWGGGGFYPIPKFKANRPFIYAIVHKPTKSILFVGCLTRPKEVVTADRPKLKESRGDSTPHNIGKL